MGEVKSIIWAGFDVGKASFVAALDEATASERRKVTSLPCREFKRNQDEVKKFFRWAKEEFPEAEVLSFGIVWPLGLLWALTDSLSLMYSRRLFCTT